MRGGVPSHCQNTLLVQFYVATWKSLSCVMEPACIEYESLRFECVGGPYVPLHRRSRQGFARAQTHHVNLCCVDAGRPSRRATMGRKRTRAGRTRSLSEEQIQEVLQNYDMECMYTLLNSR